QRQGHDHDQQGQEDVAGGQLEPEGGDDAEAPGPGAGAGAGQVGPGHVGLEPVDRGEGVAPLAEAVDDAGQGGQRLGPVTAAVVEEDDRPGRGPGQDPVDDRVDAGAPPVPGVVVPPHRVQAEVGGDGVGPLGADAVVALAV